MLLGIVRIGQGVILWFEILIIGKEKPGKSRFGIDEVDIIFFFEDFIYVFLGKIIDG